MMTSKQIVRNDIAKLRQSLTWDDVVGRSQIICKSIEKTDLFQAAHCVALYCATGLEVQTSGMMEAWCAEKQIVLPVISGENMHFYPFTGIENLRKGVLGILEPVSRESVPPVFVPPMFVPPDPVSFEPVSPSLGFFEPVPPEAIDIFVVPGIAFDYEGHRLGRGKGYYDRYLSGLNKPTIGLCFDFQLVERIPNEIHDRKMTLVITESVIVSSHHQ